MKVVKQKSILKGVEKSLEELHSFYYSPRYSSSEKTPHQYLFGLEHLPDNSLLTHFGCYLLLIDLFVSGYNNIIVPIYILN